MMVTKVRYDTIQVCAIFFNDNHYCVKINAITDTGI